MNYCLENIENINNSSNEIITRYSLNRNFEKLLQNDIELDILFNGSDSIKNNIRSYSPNIEYRFNDIVWYYDGQTLFLLRSVLDHNKNKPLRTIVNKQYTFEPSGWRDLYSYGAIVRDMTEDQISISSDNEIIKYVLETFNKNIQTYHASDGSFHKFGELVDDVEQVDIKLLKRDFTNIDTERKKNHYPNHTINLIKDNVIQYGFARKWDCGLLEYDIIYKLGFRGEYTTINGTEYEVIHTNELVLSDLTYANTSADFDILAQAGDINVQMNEMYQINLNPFCNTYSATINFQIPFIDTNYTIFGSDMPVVDRDSMSPTIDTNPNHIVYTNKGTDSVVPVYLLQPKENVSGSGLVTNTFHCKIVGRWK